MRAVQTPRVWARQDKKNNGRGKDDTMYRAAHAQLTARPSRPPETLSSPGASS